MRVTPTLCGSVLSDRRSVVAFTWTITTLLTLSAFILASALVIHTHTHYKRLERYYEAQYEEYNEYQQAEGEEDRDREEGENSADRKIQEYLALSSVSSGSISFVAAYTVSLALGLALYGSTAIIGFTSLRGVYIAPCFSSDGLSRLKMGAFGGAIVFFANLLLICAVVFGEVRVEDWKDHRDGGEDREAYEVERIATILAVTCMFLAALYTVFAVLLFLYMGNGDINGFLDDNVVASKPLPSLSNDPRRETFLTMSNRD